MGDGEEGRDPEAWKAVYEATTPAELQAAYADWAAHYDRETMALGYCLPFVVTSWLARYVPRGEGPLLDAGCGTGLSGPIVRALGYDRLEGLDMSPDMLRIAGSRGAYAALRQAELGKPLPWSDGHFRAVFSTGVFTEGHAPASGFDELVRVMVRGGHAIVTIRDILMGPMGYGAKFDELAAAGRWRLVEESTTFRAFVVGEPNTLLKAFVFEIL
ncbi:MAG: methyltransferase domain-containing protein [Rhizobiaceae bacterium]|nr:methyltransferase domain-containing protein [Rhizobiaceae bacterium]